MSTLKTTNLQESNASGANIVLGTGGGGGATISGVTTATTLRATTGIVTAFSGDITIDDKIVHAGDTNTALRFPSADTFTVETAGSERLRIDSNGKVYHQPSGNGSFEVKWTDINSNGPYAKFWNTDSAYGGGVQVKNNNARGGVEFLNASGSSVAALYNSTGGWHWGGNLILDSGGIGFNDNAVANHLDDYEEGTHTMTQVGSGGGLTLTNNIIRYTKIGDLVHISGMVDPTVVSGSSNVELSLPFTSIADSGTTKTRSTGALMYKYVNMAGSTEIGAVGYVGQNENYMRVYFVQDNGDWGQMNTSDLSTSTEIFFTITYKTSS